MVQPAPRGRNPFDETGVHRSADGLARYLDRPPSLVHLLENALAAAPGVGEAAALAVPDEMMGEKVGAVIVPLAGASMDIDAVLSHVRQSLADFKVPQYIALREEPLPRNPAGKVLKAQLRDQTEWGKPLR